MGALIPAISLPAHGLDHSGCLDEFAVFGGVCSEASLSRLPESSIVSPPAPQKHSQNLPRLPHFPIRA
jgi:hypothetical protein